jgi:hypothetical protein
MPSFTKPGAGPSPFGKNVYLRSTQDVKTKTYTVAAASVAAELIDGISQKVLQAGEVMAKITSGGDTGKIGPFDDNVGVTDGRQLIANVVGINDTFLPWQLLEHDVDVAVVYEATVVQAWCFERENGARIALATAGLVAGLRAGVVPLDVQIIFQ